MKTIKTESSLTQPAPLMSHADSVKSTYGLSIEGLPEIPRTVIVQMGHEVDVSAPRWVVFGAANDIRVGDLPIKNVHIRRATELYLIDCLKNLAPRTVSGSCQSLMKLSLSPSFVKADTEGDDIPASIVREISDEMKRQNHSHYRRVETAVRLWYIWCADMGFPHFDPDVATELELLVIGADPRGLAVLSNDPNRGPLSNIDFNALCVQLNSIDNKCLTSQELFDYCLVWLCVALGANINNLVYLCEGDLATYSDSESDETIYMLNVPRIKKRGKSFRDEFKARKLHPFIGRLLKRLISENEEFRVKSSNWHKFGGGALRPIFMRGYPDKRWLGTDAQAYSWFHSPDYLGSRITQFIDKLKIPAAAAPERFIRVYPRRLRYTFATRLVKEGASPQVVAEALDHTDLQHVMVYFNVRDEMVSFLDRANPRLASVAQMFTGLLIDEESQAERGGDPTSRIYLPPGTRSAEPIGNCGNMGFCNDAAPIACYTCRFFRPWRDAPHHRVFDFLADLRQRKIDAGADVKNVQIHDTTLMAVARVMELCEGAAV